MGRESWGTLLAVYGELPAMPLWALHGGNWAAALGGKLKRGGVCDG